MLTWPCPRSYGNIFSHVKITDVYIDDVGAFTQKGWDIYNMLLDNVLGVLTKN